MVSEGKALCGGVAMVKYHGHQDAERGDVERTQKREPSDLQLGPISSLKMPS